ncbi:hypothetical protein TB1_029437 [Malus domestica]
MMVMASNIDEYAVVGRAKYEELQLEYSVIWNHQGNEGKHDGSRICYMAMSNVSTNSDARDNGISQALSEGEVAGGKGNQYHFQG